MIVLSHFSLLLRRIFFFMPSKHIKFSLSYTNHKMKASRSKCSTFFTLNYATTSHTVGWKWRQQNVMRWRGENSPCLRRKSVKSTILQIYEHHRTCKFGLYEFNINLHIKTRIDINFNTESDMAQQPPIHTMCMNINNNFLTFSLLQFQDWDGEIFSWINFYEFLLSESIFIFLSLHVPLFYLRHINAELTSSRVSRMITAFCSMSHL